MTKKAKSKEDAKALKQQKRHHRQWVTFLRMCRYGVNNFTRNAWLTVAATAVMTITLFVIFVSVLSQNVLHNTVNSVRDKVSMSLYLKTDTTQDQVDQVISGVKKLHSVIAVTAVSPEEARTAFIDQRKGESDTLDAVKEATNKFPWTLNVKIADINNTKELSDYIANDATAKQYIDPDHPASFAGDRRTAIENIAHTANFIQQVSIVVSVVLVAISMLIIFNTIRMAIFNRREEIQMMKLIGAERSFIRGPFLVEAIVYGFFAAILASALGYTVLTLSAPGLLSAQVDVQPTLDSVKFYAGFVLLGMIVLGAIIGVISSSLATRRYLKL